MLKFIKIGIFYSNFQNAIAALDFIKMNIEKVFAILGSGNYIVNLLYSIVSFVVIWK